MGHFSNEKSPFILSQGCPLHPVLPCYIATSPLTSCSSEDGEQPSRAGGGRLPAGLHHGGRPPGGLRLQQTDGPPALSIYQLCSLPAKLIFYNSEIKLHIYLITRLILIDNVKYFKPHEYEYAARLHSFAGLQTLKLPVRDNYYRFVESSQHIC